MGRENSDGGELRELWTGDEQPVPLTIAAAPQQADDGDRAIAQIPEAQEERPMLASDVTAERMLQPSRQLPPSGWRRALFQLTAGVVHVGLGPGELRERELRARVKTPVAGCRRIAFLSRKGGVGKTSTCLLTGHTFALHRGDRVVCLDANPDAGTLAHRLRRETAATVTTLLGDAHRIERYADIRAYTSQAPSRLEVVAADDDPHITEALREEDYQHAIGLLEHHYNLVLLDTGTGILESATRGVLDAADQLVLITSPSLDGARAASLTLEWLNQNGYDDLATGAVAVLNATRPQRGAVDLDRIEEHFRARCRAFVRVPWDAHLDTGAEVDTTQLAPPTRDAYLALAAELAAAFPRHLTEEVLTMPPLYTSLVLAATNVGGDPNANGLPGSSALEKLISGVAFWALLAALAGLLVSAAIWALSSHSGNYHHTSIGRRGTIIAALAALLVGAGPAIIAFFEDLGKTVK